MTRQFILWLSVLLFICYALYANNPLYKSLPVDNISLLQPSPSTYLIWFLLFVLLVYWVYTQFASTSELTLQRTLFFCCSCFFCIFWHASFSNGYYLLSLAFLFITLLSLIALYKTYYVADHRLAGRLSISILLAFLSCMFITSISIVIQHYALVPTVNEQSITILMIVLSALFALFIQRRERDNAFPLVFVWYFVGIAEANSAYNVVVATYMIAGVLLTLSIIVSYYKGNTPFTL